MKVKVAFWTFVLMLIGFAASAAATLLTGKIHGLAGYAMLGYGIASVVAASIWARLNYAHWSPILRRKSKIRKLWKTGAFIEHGVRLPKAEYNLPWVPYETYMKAQFPDGERVGEAVRLLVDFPPEASEDNELHIHPVSDRVITVIRGAGEFIAVINKQFQRFPLQPGDRVHMPRGVLHTFLAGIDGLLVESLHNPFVAFDDPQCLVYPKKEVYHV